MRSFWTVIGANFLTLLFDNLFVNDKNLKYFQFFAFLFHIVSDVLEFSGVLD